MDEDPHVEWNCPRNRSRLEAFVSHVNAALTPRARLRPARLIMDRGWPPARADERYDVSWRKATKRARRASTASRRPAPATCIPSWTTTPRSPSTTVLDRFHTHESASATFRRHATVSRGGTQRSGRSTRTGGGPEPSLGTPPVDLRPSRAGYSMTSRAVTSGWCCPSGSVCQVTSPPRRALL